MNFEQILSFVRQGLLFGGGLLVAKGKVDDATVTSVVGAVLALASSGWALYTRRNTGLIASAAGVPSVQKIESTSPTAQSVSPKVVAPGA